MPGPVRRLVNERHDKQSSEQSGPERTAFGDVPDDADLPRALLWLSTPTALTVLTRAYNQHKEEQNGNSN